MLARSGSDVHGVYSVANGQSRVVQGFSKDAAATRTAQYISGSAIYTQGTPFIQVIRRAASSIELFHNGTQVATTPIVTGPWTSFSTLGVGSTPASTSPFHGWAGAWTIDKALSNDEIAALSSTLLAGAWQ